MTDSAIDILRISEPGISARHLEQLKRMVVRTNSERLAGLLLGLGSAESPNEFPSIIDLLNYPDRWTETLFDPVFFYLLQHAMRARTQQDSIDANGEAVQLLKEIECVVDDKRSSLSAKCGDPRLSLGEPEWHWVDAGAQTPSLVRAMAGAKGEIEATIGSNGCILQLSQRVPPPRNLLSALRTLQHIAPETYAALRMSVRYFCPFQSERVHSFTIGDMPGCIFVDCGVERFPMWFLEHIVHEFAHSKMIWMDTCQPLTRMESARRFASPWRRDARPAWGVFQAAFVNWHVLHLMRRLVEACTADPGILDLAFVGSSPGHVFCEPWCVSHTQHGAIRAVHKSEAAIFLREESEKARQNILLACGELNLSRILTEHGAALVNRIQDEVDRWSFDAYPADGVAK